MKMAAGYMSKTFAKAEKKDQEELAAESSPEGENTVKRDVACLMMPGHACQPHGWLTLAPSCCSSSAFVRGSVQKLSETQQQLIAK